MLSEGLSELGVDGDVELSLRGQLHDARLHVPVVRLQRVKVGQHGTSCTAQTPIHQT